MRWPLIATGVVALIALAAVLAVPGRGTSTTQAVHTVDLAPFTLARTDGTPFGNADLRGRIHLVYFGFTTCPDVCPTELGWMARVLRHLGPLEAQVQPVFITIDPERDSAERIADYAGVFHPRMLALRGTPEQTRIAADAFGVIYRKQTPVSQQPGFYLLDHTMTTFVLDRDGRVVHRLASHEVDPEQAAALIRAMP